MGRHGIGHTESASNAGSAGSLHAAQGLTFMSSTQKKRSIPMSQAINYKSQKHYPVIVRNQFSQLDPEDEDDTESDPPTLVDSSSEE